MSTVINTRVFVGLNEQTALELARDSELKARISSRNGKSLILTRDLNKERVNLDIKDGKVIDCTVG